MASTPANSPGSVVVDANVLIAFCAKEKDKFTKAHDALADYAQKGWLFYAPGVVVGEVLYVLCGKLQKWRPNVSRT
jgi:predicted nucleic acid-binding protein